MTRPTVHEEPLRWLPPEQIVRAYGTDKLFKEPKNPEDWLSETVQQVQQVEATPAKVLRAQAKRDRRLEKNTRNRRRRRA